MANSKSDIPQTLQTGLIYDEFMLKHRCTWDDNHIETPDRLRRSFDKCHQYGLIQKCLRLKPRNATLDEIQLYHDSSFVSSFVNCAKLDEDRLIAITQKFDDVYLCKESFDAALLSAGCTIEATVSVLENRCKNSMALVRPPGHHAMQDEANGFCLFNNVVIAAKVALNEYKLERILIVDWDVHHGQGTQRAFYDDRRVLYFSIHRYENGLFWPNLAESNWDHIGSGAALGFNVNVPLNKTGLGDAEYLRIFQQVLMPMALEFQPQLILVSAGYDAAMGCPEGKMNVTPACFATMTKMLMCSVSKGKLCVVLEGGYCLKSLEESVAMTLRALLNMPCPTVGCMNSGDSCVNEVILNLTHLLKDHWSCFHSFHLYHNILSQYLNSKPFFPQKAVYCGQPVVLDVYPTRNKYPTKNKELESLVDAQVDSVVASYAMSTATPVVTLGFDKLVQEHFDHDKDSIECPHRLEAILKALKRYQLIDNCQMVAGRQASLDELLTCHEMDYIQKIRKNSYIHNENNEYHGDVVYTCDATFMAASYAVGVCLNVVDAVLDGNAECGFALVRPPGHFASKSVAHSYCIFNNVAIAAKYALNKFYLKKILIIDWSKPCGSNATSKMVGDDGSFMCISFSHNSKQHCTCIQSSNSFHINICSDEFCDNEFIFVLFNLVLPAVFGYGPDIILVSAPFDERLTVWSLSYLTFLLRTFANGRLIMVLEVRDGYDIAFLKKASTSCLRSLFGDLGDERPNLKNQPNESHLRKFAELTSKLPMYNYLFD